MLVETLAEAADRVVAEAKAVGLTARPAGDRPRAVFLPAYFQILAARTVLIAFDRSALSRIHNV
jgi:hypothetical protein